MGILTTRIHRSVSLTIFVGVTQVTTAGVIPDLRFLTIDESRTQICTDINASFATGALYTDARNWLLDPVNYGLGGIIERDVQLLTTLELTADSLSNADIVFISIMQQSSLSQCELRELQAFVDQGGGLFISENNSANLFGSFFGADGQAGGHGGNGLFLADQVTNGPFGNLGGTVFGLNFHQHFGPLGPDGRPLLVDGGDLVVAAAFDHGLGNVVMICDEEWLWSFSINGCGSASSSLGIAQLFFLNSIAYIMPPEKFAYVPVPWPDCVADMNIDCTLNFFDVSLFLTLFSAGDPVADINSDGALNFFDVSSFLQAFTAGCS